MNSPRTVPTASTPGLVSLEVASVGSGSSKAEYTVFVLTLCAGENRWNLEFTKAVRKALKYVSDVEEASVLITKSASPKFFSNGLDLASLQANPSIVTILGAEVMGAFADVLELPIPTICLIEGHAFGAGMMVALAHDYRLQRAGKGFLCANEIELGMPIPPPELDLFAHAMAPIDYFDTVLSAKRWDGAEAFRRGLVHATGSAAEIDTALLNLIRKVAPLGLNRANMRKFKKDVKGRIANGLRSYKVGESNL